jgi:hypothetical protein
MRQPENGPPKQSLLGTFAKTALTMVAYGIGIKVFRGLAFKANVGLGKLAVSLAERGSTARGILESFTSKVRTDPLIHSGVAKKVVDFERHVSQWATTSLERINTGLHPATSGDFAGQRYFVKKTVQGASAWAGRLTHNLVEKVHLHPSIAGPREVKDIRFTNLLKHSTWAQNNNFIKRMTELKNTHLLEPHGDMFAPLSAAGRRTARIGQRNWMTAMKGRAIRYVADVASYAPLDYAMMRMMSNDDKKWYDPSAVKDWAGFTLGSDILFRGMGPIGKLALGKAKQIAKGAFDSFDKGDLHRMTKTGLDFVDKVINNKFTTALFGVHKEMKAMGENPTSVAQIPRYMAKFANRMHTVWNDTKQLSEFRGKQHESVTETALRQAMTDYRHSTRSGQFSGDESYAEQLRRNHLNELKEISQEKKGTANISKLNSLFGDNSFQAAYLDASSVDAASKLYGMEVRNQISGLHKGPGVFRFGGKEYNFTNLMPRNIAARVGKFLSGAPSVFGVPLFGVLGIKPMFRTTQEQAYFKSWNHGETFGMGVQTDIGAIANIIDHSHQDTIDLEAAKKHNLAQGDIKYYQEAQGHQVKTRALMTKVFNDATAVAHNRSFHAMDEQGAMKFEHEIARGVVEVSENERIHFMGNKAYLFSKGEANNTVFQLGYDAKKGNYHQLEIIEKEQGGGMMNLLKNYFGRGKYTSYKAGRETEVTSHNMAAVHQDDVEFSDHPFKKAWTWFKDVFEFGDKEQQGDITKIVSSIGKFADPLNLRVMFSKTKAFAGNGWESAMSYQEKLVAGKKLSSVMGTNDILMTKNLLNDNSFVKGIAQHVKDVTDPKDHHSIDNLANLMIDYKGGHINVMSDEFKSSLDKFISEDFHKYKDILGNEMYNKMSLLAGVMRHGSLTDTTAMFNKELMGFKDIKVNYKEAWNGFIGKAMFHNLGNQETEMVVSNLKNSSSFGHMKNDIDLLYNVHTINKVRQLNLTSQHPDDIVDAFSQFAEFANGTNGQGVADATRRTINKMESLLSPNMHRTDIRYPDKGASGMDIILSTGKDIDGHKIMDINEELFPKMLRKSFLSDVLADQKNTDFRPDSPLTMKGMGMMQALNAVNSTGNVLGLGFEKSVVTDPALFFGKVLAKRVLPAIGIMAAWGAADAAIDNSGVFDGSVLGDGLNVLAGDVGMRIRMGIARVNDATGITGLAKKMENLMPGSVNSPLSGAIRGLAAPVAGIQLGFKFGGATGGIIGGAIGGGISLLTAGGPLATLSSFDITKRRSELIEEYSGRADVPHMKSANWLLSLSPMGGQRIERWEPNWYHQIRSEYQYTPVLYGNKFERLANMFNPHHYEDQHAITRPYPASNAYLSNIPIIGDIASIGGRLAGQDDLKYMNLAMNLGEGKAFAPDVAIGGPSNNLAESTMTLAGGTGGTPSSSFVTGTPSPFGSNGYTDGSIQLGNAQLASSGTGIISPFSAPARIKQSAQSFSDFMGLRGFLVDTAFTGLSNSMVPFENMPQYQSASRMTAFNRTYWDADLGDMLGLNEFIRRLVPKYGQHINSVNAMVNAMPNWLPGDTGFIDFQKGDPYTKVKKGELRLPGSGYDSAHNVAFTVPLEAEYLGQSYGDQVGMLTGTRLPASPDFKYDRVLKDTVRNGVAQQLSAQNKNIKMNAPYYDPNIDMGGKADIVTNTGIMQIKPVSSETFSQLSAPLQKDQSETNALLNMSNMFTGTIMYVNGDSGETRTFTVRPDPQEYQADTRQLLAARARTIDMIRDKGPSLSNMLGNAYSRVDRLRILSDVAPYGDEFKQTLSQVRALKNAGKLDSEEIAMLDRIIAQRSSVMDRYRFTDYRFLRGTPITEDEKQLQDNIADSYSDSERTIGSVWEWLSHKQSLLNDKGLNTATALEQYQRNEVYGTPLRDWAHPYRDFVRPLTTSALNQDGVVQSAMSIGAGAFMLGGVPGSPGSLAAGIAGATTGALYGALHEQDIPAYRKRERDMIATLDKINYMKAKEDADNGDPEAYDRMTRTMTYAYQHMSNPSLMFSAAPRPERAFLKAFTQAGTVEERDQIMKMVPDYIKPFLEQTWSGQAGQAGGVDDPMRNVGVPGRKWAGWDPSLSASDIAISVMDQAGQNAHDLGMGWQNERRRMQFTGQRAPTSFGPMAPVADQNSVPRVVAALRTTLNGAMVSGVSTMGDGIVVNVRIE